MKPRYRVLRQPNPRLRRYFSRMRQSHSAAATQYIVRRRKPRVAHVWAGDDTRCRMASTGGLDLANYDLVSEPGLPVCAMCIAAAPLAGRELPPPSEG